MYKKKIFITKELKNSNQDLKEYGLHNTKTLSGDPIDFFKAHTNAKDLIYIYDLGFNKRGKIISIINHINKTGVNVLRQPKNKKIKFYDITEIYKPQKKGQIAECFGDKSLPNKKNKTYIQTRFLCNYVIAAYYIHRAPVFAYVID